MIKRCDWVGNDPLNIAYHDREWGVPTHDDPELFELLILEGMQAGLSWLTILRKRENFRHAFDQFDVQKVAAYDEQKIAALLADPGIIRNKLKLRAAVSNAQAVLAVQAEYGHFDTYLWSFVDGHPRQNTRQTLADLPAQTPISEAMSKDLRRRGFKFVGPTICYALMQSAGLVNDHLISCFRHQAVQEAS